MRYHNALRTTWRCLSCLLVFLWLAAIFTSGAPSTLAQGTFSSGSNGSDGALDLSSQPSGTTVWFYPSNYPGNQHANGVFNWTTITIPTGVTLKLSGFITNMPLYFLASGNVSISGTIDLSGTIGHPDTTSAGNRIPAAPGPGGYTGGVGGINGSTKFPAESGGGQGGGAAGSLTVGSLGRGGTFSGSAFLIPLVGGSGGGGSWWDSNNFSSGGGGGGGALLIASSTSISINGTINANGGAGGLWPSNCPPNPACAGGGSGGAVRLVSNTISGSGSLTAQGGASYYQINGNGTIRLEAYTNSFTGTVTANYGTSTPFQLVVPTTVQPTIQVTSINGVSINENPFKFPDIQINSAAAIPVVISAQQIPPGTVPTIILLTETGDQVITAPALAGTVSFSSSTVNITFPGGGTWGLVKATWN